MIFPGCKEKGIVEVASGTPASIECNVTTNARRIEVKARPGDGGATGFAGHLSF